MDRFAIAMHNKNIIHCIGDSHASFFSGSDEIQPVWPDKSRDYIPSFRSYRLGPVTAYNLCNSGSSTHGREKLFEVLKTLPAGSNVLLCFGEIDCRVHLLKQSELQNRLPEEVVGECVRRYFEVIKEVVILGYKVLVWGPIPSSSDEVVSDPEFPVFGNNSERNRVTKIFNESLKKMILEFANPNLRFVSIFSQLSDESGKTRFAFYNDKIHLSQRAMPLAIRSILEVLPEIDVKMFGDDFFGNFPLSIQMFFYKIETVTRKIIYMLKKSISKVIGKSKFLSDQKIIIDWYRHGRPVPPPHLIKQDAIKKIARKFGMKYFVETGTFFGDMVEAMKPVFEKLISIELDKDLFEKAKQRFSADKKVQILNGDSGKLMPEVLASFGGKNAVFWLDGHYSSGITAKGDLNTPIYQELKAIFGDSGKHAVLIDDARLFVGKEDYPTLEELKKFVSEERSGATFEVKDDIIRIY